MKKVFLIACVIFGFKGFGQSNTTNQFSLNLITPSAEYEFAIGKKAGLNLNLGVGFAYHQALSESEFGIFPVFEGQYRYFYNFEKRINDLKKTSENSANYIAMIAAITNGDPIIGDLKYPANYGALVGPAWGLQRIYLNGFKLNLNLGIGYGFDDKDASYVTPIMALRLGWILGR